MYLSYSGWKKFVGCWLAYWHSYIGRTPTPGPDDRLGSIFGSVTGKLFEDFYNEQLYRKPQPQGEVMGRVDATIQQILKQETTTTSKWRTAGVLLWKGPKKEGKNPKGMYANVEELAADVRDAVARGFSIIRHYRLLGKDARAEVPLDSMVEGHKLGGRSDFIMTRVKPHNDEVVLDGKGSKYRDAYTDVRQLKWYAMLFREQFKRLPNQLGFVYWRFDPPESIDWYPVDEAEIDGFKQGVLEDIRRIGELEKGLTAPTTHEAVRKVFVPIAEKPGVPRKEVEQECRFCPFATEEICPAGAQVVEEIKRR